MQNDKKLELQPAEADYAQLVLVISLIGFLNESGILASAVQQAKQLGQIQRSGITLQARLQRLDEYLTAGTAMDMRELVMLIAPLPFNEAIKAKLLALNVFPAILPQVTPAVINDYMAAQKAGAKKLIFPEGSNATRH